MERMHSKILRTIQGLPTRCPREGVRALLDCSSVADLVSTRKLCFIVSIASLPPNTLARNVLMARVRTSTSHPKSWTSTSDSLLENLCLPSIEELMVNTPRRSTWRKCVTCILKARARVELEEIAVSKPSLELLGSIYREYNGCPPIWQVSHSAALRHFTPACNFRARLLMGCHGLEADAARFRTRRGPKLPGDSQCPLCNAAKEDATHFIANCPALEDTRRKLLAHAPQSSSQIARDQLVQATLRVIWFDDLDVQKFLLSLLNELRSTRATLLCEAH